MSDLEQALADALAQDDRHAAMLAGGRLALARTEAGDLEGLASLLRHESLAVRHGAVEALDLESPSIEPALGTLAEALADNTDAVLHHGLQALKRAAKAGVDIGPAVGALRGLFSNERYGLSGWTFGLDPGEQSDLHTTRPNQDAAAAIAYHALAHHDLDTLRGLLRHSTASVVMGTLDAVQAERRHADASRREQAARLLVIAYTGLTAWKGIQELLASKDAALARGARAGVDDALGGELADDARAELEALQSA